MTDGKHRGPGRLPRERRRFPRTATTFSADLVVGKRRFATRVVNLSMGGALLDFRDVSPRPRIAAGARLSVEMRCRAVERPFATEARAVLWNKALGPQPLLAIQFDEVRGEDAETLEDLMAEALVDLGRLKVPMDVR
jgi:hypothetical protein